MTTLTPVKYITQQELLDALPRTMYGEKGNAAPGTQLGHTMPVDLPFWLGVSKPFNKVTLKRKKKKKQGGVCIHIFLPYKAYLTTSSTFPYNGEMNRCRACQRPMCTANYGEKNKMRFGSATVRLRLDFVHLEASWSPSRRPCFWSSVNWSRGGLLVSAGSKLESLLLGSVDHEKTLSLSSLLGQSWLVTSEAPMTQGLNPAALLSLR